MQILAWLIEAYKDQAPKGEGIPRLEGDCALAIVAGRYITLITKSREMVACARMCCRPLTAMSSDTTAAALVFLFCCLAREPSVVQKLREELNQVDDIRNHQALLNLPYLNSVITEGLRLHPPVPGGFPRQTPSEGVTIADQFIPGEVTCVAPNYTIARCKP